MAYVYCGLKGFIKLILVIYHSPSSSLLSVYVLIPLLLKFDRVRRKSSHLLQSTEQQRKETDTCSMPFHSYHVDGSIQHFQWPSQCCFAGLSNPSNFTVRRTCGMHLTLDTLDRIYITSTTPERKCFDLATLETLTISEVSVLLITQSFAICNVNMNFLKTEILYCTVAL